jgi:hypothetical protein
MATVEHEEGTPVMPSSRASLHLTASMRVELMGVPVGIDAYLGPADQRLRVANWLALQ